MLTIRVEIEELSEDGLIEKLWTFCELDRYDGKIHVVLQSYTESTRKSRRHRKWVCRYMYRRVRLHHLPYGIVEVELKDPPEIPANVESQLRREVYAKIVFPGDER